MSNRVSLRLITNTIEEARPSETFPPHPEGDQDHIYLIEQYIQTHLVKNYSPATINREKRFLISWFKEYGNGFRPLYTWEAMVPIEGRKRILTYLQLLLKSGISTATVRSYSGILKRYFEYILNFPYLTNHNNNISIEDKYNRLAQPVIENDIPRHTCNEEKRGIPIDPAKLQEFYSIVRKYYITDTSKNHTRARNYTLIVLAGESGLRIDELLPQKDVHWPTSRPYLLLLL